VHARLYRAAQDLPRLRDRPGRIRFVKVALLELADIAWPCEAPELAEVYLRYATSSPGTCGRTPRTTGASCARSPRAAPHPSAPWEFETLLGLRPDRLAEMAALGPPAREDIVFGAEWWLYVCNRSPRPQRLLQAVIDAATPS
jgi:proline dehydrogenase